MHSLLDNTVKNLIKKVKYKRSRAISHAKSQGSRNVHALGNGVNGLLNKTESNLSFRRKKH